MCVVLAGVAMMQIVGSPYVKAGHGANGKHPPPPPSTRCMVVNGCDDRGGPDGRQQGGAEGWDSDVGRLVPLGLNF